MKSWKRCGNVVPVPLHPWRNKCCKSLRIYIDFWSDNRWILRNLLVTVKTMLGVIKIIRFSHKP